MNSAVRKKPHKDLVGNRYGRLVVISLVDDIPGADIPTRWLCRCDCGNEIIVRGYNLKSGQTNSCGCLRRELAAKKQLVHGESKSRLYNIWAKMRHRCENEAYREHKDYGGRGITVCKDWSDSYEAFREWAQANGYNDTLSLDRIDNNGNYCPENCRWTTQKVQNLNKRSNVRIVFDGRIQTISEWADEFKCRPSMVCRIIIEKLGLIVKQGECGN